MDIITIEIKAASVIVHEHRLPKSHLRYTSPVLHIYVLGNASGKVETVAYHAVSEAVKRGGRAMDVKRVPCNCGAKRQSGQPELLTDTEYQNTPKLVTDIDRW